MAMAVIAIVCAQATLLRNCAAIFIRQPILARV